MLERDKKSLALLVDHEGIIHKLCFMYTNNSDEYKDLRQEVSYQLIKSYKNFKGDSKLSTWVYKVSMFTALAFIKRKPKAHLPLDYASNTVGSIPTYNAWDDVHRQIKKLPDIEKSLIFLYLEDKSYKEIAEIMGITETNVGARLNRIKNKLKHYFKDE